MNKKHYTTWAVAYVYLAIAKKSRRENKNLKNKKPSVFIRIKEKAELTSTLGSGRPRSA